MANPNSSYQSPLQGRYASPAMLKLFSNDTRYGTWRRLWVALAETEMELGLPITREQVEQLRAHVDDIDYDVVAAKEKEIRHDVMAHVYAYGVACPDAKGIIHLGATSCYVTDNADVLILKQGLEIIRKKMVKVLENLAAFAKKYRDLPTLGYTHLQPAQPDRRQARHALDAGSADGLRRPLLFPVPSAHAGVARHDRHAGFFHGAVRWRSGKGQGAG